MVQSGHIDWKEADKPVYKLRKMSHPCAVCSMTKAKRVDTSRFPHNPVSSPMWTSGVRVIQHLYLKRMCIRSDSLMQPQSAPDCSSDGGRVISWSALNSTIKMLSDPVA